MSWGTNLDALLRTAIDGVVLVDHAGVVRGWNHHAETIFGWREREAIGQPLTQLVVPEFQRESFALRVAQVASGVDPKLLGSRFELTAMRRNGTTVPIELGVMAVEQAGERCIVGFVRDLTEARRARAELRRAQRRLAESEERYRYTIDLSGMIAWTADANGKINGVGERWRDWTGTVPEVALAEGWMRFIHPADAPEVAHRWSETVRAGNRIDITYRLLGEDGVYRWVNARATKRVDGDPGGTVWYGTLEDVHDGRLAAEASQRTQAELEHVSRLGAMGAMASAIAHDLNQPLTAIAHYVRGSRRLAETLTGDNRADLLAALSDADRSVVRAGDIVRRVREFVTRGAVEQRVETLGDIIAESARFALTDAAEKGVSISLSLTGDCQVFVDRVQMQQVFVNLIRNAVEAMEGRPHRELTIATSRRVGECEVVVSDTGRGVPEEVRGRLFDPFYTTRANGMGVGLSITRTIVEGHGGTISLDPPNGGGATFRFTLPLAEAEEPRRAPEAAE